MKVSGCKGASAIYGEVDDSGLRPIVGFRKDYTDWFVRDKRDGVLVVWRPDKGHLMSRNGGYYTSPQWWRDMLPDLFIQGELVFKELEGEDSFHEISGIARRSWLDDEDWEKIEIAAFDIYEGKGTYANRVVILRKSLGWWKKEHPTAPVSEIPVRRIESNEWLVDHVADRFAEGREGVVLYDPQAHYQKGKTGAMRKVVALYRTEAIVIRHSEGSGKHKGRLGAYRCCLRDDPKVKFSVGTGMNDAHREDPAPPGSIIVVEFKSRKGSVPNQPVFKGVRSRRDLD